MPRLLWLWLWTVCAAAQIQQPPPTPPGKGGIEGAITDAGSHEPLKKGQVTLSGPIAPPLTVVTDASGRFAFHDLPAGSYWLNASKPGYNPPQQSLLATESSAGVMLAEGEQKKGIEIALTHGGAISGRVTREDGAGVQGCMVTAVQPAYEENHRTLRSMGGQPTNEKGEYRIQDLGQGRYQVFVHCQHLLPAAHALLPRGDPRTPHEAYLPQFYGGRLDPSTATRLTLAAGASLDNIDLELTRAPALTLHGTISGSDPDALAGGVNLMLLPVNRLMRGLVQWGAQANPLTRTFEIQPVVPGSYLLFAFNVREGRTYAAQRMVEVGNTPPEPLEITLAGSSDLKGSVQFDSDDHPTLENYQIILSPADRPIYMQQPQGQTDKEGAFTLTGVMPGRWRLMVNAVGFVKSVWLGGQQVSPYALEIAAGAAGPLRIVLGTRMANVSVSVTGVSSDRQVSALIFPEEAERQGAGLERAGTTIGAGQIEFPGMPPGRYRVIATDIPNSWPILQRPDILKVLEGRTAVVEVQEAGKASTTVELTPREELMRAVEEKE